MDFYHYNFLWIPVITFFTDSFWFFSFCPQFKKSLIQTTPQKIKIKNTPIFLFFRYVLLKSAFGETVFGNKIIGNKIIGHKIIDSVYDEKKIKNYLHKIISIKC